MRKFKESRSTRGEAKRYKTPTSQRRVAKDHEKKGITTGIKEEFFLSFAPLWFKAFMLFVTPSTVLCALHVFTRNPLEINCRV